jgi:sirohydrochlorin ferrochelatase
MDGLILFSHGSILCGASETLRAHAERLRARGRFVVVEVGYLNYSEPTFAEAVSRCAKAGVSRIIIVPYFLVPGKFVTMDLPRVIAQAQRTWPKITFRVADPLGYDEGLADAILEMAASAATREFWWDDLNRAATFCEADPQCPFYSTPRCPRAPASPIQEAAL